MRFFHRKHQCYIVAEGSFAGQHGHLPEINGDNSGADIAQQLTASLRRPSSRPPSLSKQIPTLEVQADIEPTWPPEPSSALLPSAYEFQTAKISFTAPSFDESSSPKKSQSRKGLLHSRKFGSHPVSRSKDEVVSEDGESILILCSSFCYKYVFSSFPEEASNW